MSEDSTLLCALCMADSAVIRLSSCQTMRTFHFQQGPIGLELEDLNDRVSEYYFMLYLQRPRPSMSANIDDDATSHPI